MNVLARRLALLSLAAAVAATAGCGKKRPTESESGDSDTGMPSAKELSDAAAQYKKVPFLGKDAGNALQAMSKAVADTENTVVTPVDFRVLRDMLPETAGSLKRKTREGQKEMGISTANADYGDENGSSTLTIKITDSGQMRAMMAAGTAVALSVDMDKETEDGYERNIVFQGYRAHEKKNGDSLELTTLVGNRFIVEVNGYSVKPEQLKAALESIPLKKLEGMKDEGVEKAAK